MAKVIQKVSASLAQPYEELLNALPGDLYEIKNLLSLGREYKPVGNVDGLVRLINEATEKNKAKMMQKSPEKGQPLEAKA